MREWHQPLWVCVQEIHMCRGHTGGCKHAGVQKYSSSPAAEEQNYPLVFEWCRDEEEEQEVFMASSGIVMKSNGLKLNEKSCIWLQKYPEISSKYFSVWSKRPINKSYYACVSCSRRDKAEHRTGSGDGKKEHVINFWLLFCLCSSPACHANTRTGTALCYLHTEGSVLCCYCAGPSHTWLPPHEQKLCSQAALVCLWVDLSLFAFPAALQTVPFQSRGCRIFKPHEKQGTPISSQLWELRGLFVCLNACQWQTPSTITA